MLWFGRGGGGNTVGTGIACDPNTQFTHKVYRKNCQIDLNNRSGKGKVKFTLDPVTIVWGAGGTPGPVWTGAENLVSQNRVTVEHHSVLLGLRCRAYCTD